MTVREIDAMYIFIGITLSILFIVVAEQIVDWMVTVERNIKEAVNKLSK